MAAIVEIRNLTKTFSRGSEQIRVLDNLSLEVPEGQFLALMGPSGSGKTTLLNLIAGLDSPTSGVIGVGEVDISTMSEGKLAKWRTRHVGFVFQFYHLLPVLTAYENVELPLLLLPMGASERRQRVMTALDLRSLTLGMMPGGIAEMSLTAETLQLSVPLVTALQVMRLLFVLFLAEPLFRLWNANQE